MSETSNSVLVERISNVMTKLDGMDEKAQKWRDATQEELTAIKIQTTKTNGRVNRMESEIKEHDSKLAVINEGEGKNRYNSGRTSIVINLALVFVTAIVSYLATTALK